MVSDKGRRAPGFVVEVAFQIDGRGCVLLPGFAADHPTVRVGDRIILHRPDGTELATTVAGFEMIHTRDGTSLHSAPISLPSPLTKADAPVGTVVSVVTER